MYQIVIVVRLGQLKPSSLFANAIILMNDHDRDQKKMYYWQKYTGITSVIDTNVDINIFLLIQFFYNIS